MNDLNHSRNLAVRPCAGRFHVLFLLPVMIIGFGLMMLTGLVTAQTLTALHGFTASSPNSFGVYTNSDGIGPNFLILSGNTLYGTAAQGGTGGNGTVFKVNTDGTGFTNLYIFNGSDGTNPSGLVLSGNTLYGTCSYGGNSGSGTVFALKTNGTGFTSPYSFTPTSPYYTNTNTFGGVINTNKDGAYPVGLVISSNTLYGTASGGGSSGNGTVFKVNIDGTGFTNLYNFTASSPNSLGVYTNSDGAFPTGLVLSSNRLYGTATFGGSSGSGTVFAINTDGTGFTTLHNGSIISPASLTLSGDTLYWTESGGDSGELFAVNTDGTGFTNLLTLYGSAPFGGGTPIDLDVVFLGDKLYLAESLPDVATSSALFALNTDGTGYELIYSFHSTIIPLPNKVFALSGNNLYGIGFVGVFSLSFPTKLTITASGASVILTWPTNYAGFDYTGYALQSTTNLVSSIWTTNLPAPVVINGQNTVTNPISGTQQFFRLSQ